MASGKKRVLAALQRKVSAVAETAQGASRTTKMRPAALQ
jgi:hypothetical protein